MNHYSIDTCIFCKKPLVQLDNYAYCNSDEYEITKSSDGKNIEHLDIFFFLDDGNCRYHIEVDFVKKYTKVSVLDNWKWRDLYSAEEIIDISLDEWGKFAFKLKRLQAFK